MPLLPCLGETEATENWTPEQIWSFAVCTYLMITLFLVTMVIAIRNFVTFVYHGEKCQLSHPLLGFYICVMLCLISNVVYCIYLVRQYEEWLLEVLSLPAIFKVLSGVEQMWMMLELIFHVKSEINSTQKLSTFLERQERQNWVMKWI